MFSALKKYVTTYRELEYLAYHDLLTNTYNRNWLIKNLDSIVCYFVYFIDINDLHQINSERGHVGGDEVIKEVANKLKSKFNTVVRYAGDEFIVFSDSSKLTIINDPLYSIGVVVVNGSVSEAIQEADMNMLKNKKLAKIKHL